MTLLNLITASTVSGVEREHLVFLSTKHDQDRHLNLFDEYFENNKILVGETRNREEYCFNFIVNNKIKKRN